MGHSTHDCGELYPMYMKGVMQECRPREKTQWIRDLVVDAGA